MKKMRVASEKTKILNIFIVSQSCFFNIIK